MKEGGRVEREEEEVEKERRRREEELKSDLESMLA